MPPFISLNSWNEPGTILQAAEPEEIVAGGWDDWDKLRYLLARRRKTGGDSVHPQSAAVGYITYEGAFRFAWFPRISVLRENDFSSLWHERCAQTSRGPDYLLPGSRHGGTGSDAFTPNMSREKFESLVARAQEYIA